MSSNKVIQPKKTPTTAPKKKKEAGRPTAPVKMVPKKKKEAGRPTAPVKVVVPKKKKECHVNAAKDKTAKAKDGGRIAKVKAANAQKIQALRQQMKAFATTNAEKIKKIEAETKQMILKEQQKAKELQQKAKEQQQKLKAVKK